MKTWLFLILFIFVTGCLNQAPRQATDESSEESTTIDSEYSDIDLGPSPAFIIESGQQHSSNLFIPVDYDNTLLIRGTEISQSLNNYDLSTKVCLVSIFPATTSKRVLLISGTIRRYFDPLNKTKENYLELQPGNIQKNNNDCLSLTIFSNSTGIQSFDNTLAFSDITGDPTQVCPTCNVGINSDGIRVLTPGGTEMLDIKLDHLTLGLNAPATQNTQVTSCTKDSECDSNFDCCSGSQCVKHASYKNPFSSSDPSISSIVELINQKPWLIDDYSYIYNICPTMVPTDPINNEEETGPSEETVAALHVESLRDIYQCLNPIQDEVGICTITITDAEELLEASNQVYDLDNFSASDDLNFSSFLSPNQWGNIAEITYSGETIFKRDFTDFSSIQMNVGVAIANLNQSITDGARVTINQRSKPSNAQHSLLKIRYFIDATCEKLGPSLARCKKFYKQGQSDNRTNDHPAGSSNFALPYYADTGFAFEVKVGESLVSQGTIWNPSGTSVQFTTTPAIGEEIEISYYVTGTNAAAVTTSRVRALENLQNDNTSSSDIDYCSCEGNECNLTPITNDAGVTVSYECFYPGTESNTPLQATVYLSAKSSPIRFYDVNGVHYKYDDIGNGDEQEGTKFEYIGNDKHTPNSDLTYVGFNEIYGSITKQANGSLPAQVITVERGKSYDLYTEEGTFSTCLSCGSDYYSNLALLFPNTFQEKGGGYSPNVVETRRSTSQSNLRSDDLLFGRACFVPATMIPWTHKQESTVKEQRQNRMALQHFLFANGYNRDWYGFDYGSVIGSFDGVKWFSIGNQRRIKAESDRMYLAINQYFGDLTSANTFDITITEVTNSFLMQNDIDHDLLTDGAECQKSHLCETDNDCIGQLGYDYACMNVSALKTSWPKFNTNGDEVIGTTSESLVSLLGGSNGELKRCVYRGRGALCDSGNLNTSNSSLTYAQTTNSTALSCSANTFCASPNSNNFNQKIARYPVPVSQMNNSDRVFGSYTPSDLFGLSSRIIGRPYNYIGNQSMPAAAGVNISDLNINGICVTGKDDTVNTNTLAQSVIPANKENDNVNNIGKTPASLNQNLLYLSSCSATNTDGDYIHINETSNRDSASYYRLAASNNIASNTLQSITDFSDLEIFNDIASPNSQKGIARNSCLRAPGASCFTDLDCSANSFIANKLNSSAPSDWAHEAEMDFWKTGLTCSAGNSRYIDTSLFQNPDYDPKENRCCLEVDKKFKFYTQIEDGNSLNSIKAYDTNSSGDPIIPGVDTSLAQPSLDSYYSAVNTIAHLINGGDDPLPGFVVGDDSTGVAARFHMSDYQKQYKTLHQYNTKMCCTKNWVREFADNGGHKFDALKMQTYEKSFFRQWNWDVQGSEQDNTFECDPDFASVHSYCPLFHIPVGSTTEKNQLEWLASFELLGIPQVLIASPNTAGTESIALSIRAKSDFNDQLQPASTSIMIRSFFSDENTNANNVSDTEYDGTPSNDQLYVKASNASALDLDSKKFVFSDKEFACCLPTGVEVDDTTPENACCTGKKVTSNGRSRCCLDDYTNVSVFTNRYVSSEGAGLDDAEYDDKTGYIKSTAQVLQMASQMCCSGSAMTGTAISTLPIPVTGATQPGLTRRRYVQDDDDGLPAQFFDSGVRWNHHVYCVPASGTGTGGGATGN